MVIWFSRHYLLPTQREEIARRYPDRQVVELLDAASKSISVIDDAVAIADELWELRPAAVFGVFPAPLRSVLHGFSALSSEDAIRTPFYEAWNIMRTPEGGKPTFEHKEFLLVGEYAL
jgi:hypothetical protein